MVSPSTEPSREQLADLAHDLARVELPGDGLTEPNEISAAMDDLATRDLWRLFTVLHDLVRRARRLVGEPRRRNDKPRL